MEELQALICARCGAPLKQEGNLYRCPHCDSLFESQAAEKEMEMLERLIGSEKIERLSTAKRRLWDAAHAKYPSKEEVCSCAHEVLLIDDRDPLALIYLHSHDRNPYKLCDILASLSVAESTAEEIIRWLLPSLSSELVGALHDFADRHLRDEKKTIAFNSIEGEAAKVMEGIYEPALPRDVFLCYSSFDMPKVIGIMNLIEQNGFACFAAFRNLRHGKGAAENYLMAIKTAMKSCATVVFLSSQASRSASSDALRVELPYLISDLPDKPRIEYILEDYEEVPYLVKKTLKKAFPEQEQCRDAEDLLDRIDGFVNNASKKEAEPKKVISGLHCPMCGNLTTELIRTDPSGYEVCHCPMCDNTFRHYPSENGSSDKIDSSERTRILSGLSALNSSADGKALNAKGDELYAAKNYTEAAKLYEMAAGQGNADAQCNLGFLYEKGFGVPKDREKAAEFYRKAAEQGHAKGQCGLGYLYGKGLGVPRDAAKAAAWFEKAANQGHPTALYNLGFLYENGQGVPRDREKAAELYQKAAEKGNENAKEALKQLSKWHFPRFWRK